MTDTTPADASAPDATSAPPALPGSQGGRRAVSDILRQIGGRLVNGLLGVVVAILVARALGEDDFGRWSTLIAIVTLATPLTELGIQQLGVARAAAQPHHEPHWLGSLVAVRSALAVAAAIVCLAVSLTVADGADMRLAALLLCATLLLSPVSALGAAFQLRMRNDLGIVVMTVNSVLWTAAVILVATAGGGLVPLAIVFLGAAVVSTAVELVLALRMTSVSFSGARARSRDLVRTGFPLAISGILVLGYARVDQIIVFEAAGERDAGLYGAAYRILDQASIVPMSVVATLFPVLVAAGAAADRARLRRLVQQSVDGLLTVGLGALAFCVVCGGQLLALLFGDGFEQAGTALAVLMAAYGAICVGYVMGSLVIVFQLQRRYLAYAVLGLVFNVGLNLWLVPRHGFIAAAWITLATELLVVGLNTRAVLRAMDWRPAPGPVLRAVAAAAVTAALLALLKGVDVPIGVLVPAAALLYPTALTATGALRPHDLIAIARSRGAS
jgi:O-antigen/teichoic acid export membrane protein